MASLFPPRRRPRLNLLIIALLLSASATGVAAEPNRSRDVPVNSRTLDLERHERDLPLRVSWPEVADTDGAAGSPPWPIIIFSHGATGSRDGYQPLARFWAAHGYVVIQPTHGDSRRFGGRIRDRASINRHWRDRPGDVAFILDAVDAIERQVPALADRLDPGRVAVAGHSYGAHTTMLVAGARLFFPRGDRSFTLADPRPDCFVAISPQGPGGLLRHDSYAGFDRPMLMITGDDDGSPYHEKTGAWRREAFDHAAPGGKYLLWIDEAQHGFGGIAGRIRYAGSGPEDAEQVRLVQQTTLHFFDAYLKQQDAARQQLQPARFTHDQAHLEAR